MAINANTLTSPTGPALPQIAPPKERESQKLGVWEFAKNVLLVLLVTKLSALAGYALGRFTPNEMIPKRWQHLQVTERLGKKYYPLATCTAFITGSIGGYFEGWRHWRKDKAKQLGVKDIHTDIYTELDPKILQAEADQNQRIQDGIKVLLDRKPRDIEPRASHAEEAAKDTHTALAR